MNLKGFITIITSISFYIIVSVLHNSSVLIKPSFEYFILIHLLKITCKILFQSSPLFCPISIFSTRIVHVYYLHISGPTKREFKLTPQNSLIFQIFIYDIVPLSRCWKNLSIEYGIAWNIKTKINAFSWEYCHAVVK